MYEEIEFPEKGWRPPREGAVRRVLRGEKVRFTPEQQAQYDQLLSTVQSDRAVLITCEYTGKGELAAASRKSVMDINSAVRIRLLDKEGYTMESRRADARHVAVRLHEEILFCSMTKTIVNVTQYARTSGVRLRRGHRSPVHQDGILVAELP